MKKKLIGLMLFAFLITGLSTAYANHGGGHCKYGKEKGCSSEKEHSCPITAEFFESAHGLLEHKKALGLSNEQVTAIKTLKIDMKKQVIRQMAEMQIMMIDMKVGMKADKLDTQAINTMVDKGFAGMAVNVKSVIEAYGKLKAIPTAEQWEQMKELTR